MPTVSSPFEFFTTAAGLALDGGYIYVGTAGLPAETNPIACFTNVGLTVPISQPLRTSGGRIVSGGSPVSIFIAPTDYSIVIKDKKGVLVYQTTSVASINSIISLAQGGTGATTQAGALVGLGALGNATLAKTSNYTVLPADRGDVVLCNGTFTLAITAAGTLGDGFCFAVVNTGSGTITVDPNSSELIDGASTKSITAGQSCFVVCNGTEFRTVGITTPAPGSITLSMLAADAQPISSLFSITASVATNAMTTGLNSTRIDFRNASLTSGAPTTINATGNLSLVIPAGATLGTTNGVLSRVILLCINNSGTAELAVVNQAGGVNLDETGLISTTAISASSTSASTIYSTTARTNVPYRVVGFVDSTQATAGQWATAPTLIQGGGGGATAFILDKVVKSAYADYTTYTSTASAIPNDNTIPQITEGLQLIAITYTPVSALNNIILMATLFAEGNGAGRPTIALFDGNTNAIATIAGLSTVNQADQVSLTKRVPAGSTSSRTYSMRVGDGSGTLYVNGTNAGQLYGASVCSSLTILEVAP